MVYWLMNGMKWSEKAADIKTQTKQHKTKKTQQHWKVLKKQDKVLLKITLKNERKSWFLEAKHKEMKGGQGYSDSTVHTYSSYAFILTALIFITIDSITDGCSFSICKMKSLMYGCKNTSGPIIVWAIEFLVSVPHFRSHWIKI